MFAARLMLIVALALAVMAAWQHHTLTLVLAAAGFVCALVSIEARHRAHLRQAEREADLAVNAFQEWMTEQHKARARRRAG
jgi:membrane-anchored protein YejM (alkaline phosphatase superfamily)